MAAILVRGGWYCTISTNSSVTCHKAVRSEEFVFLSQVTPPFEDSDNWISGLLGIKSFQKQQFQRDFYLVMPPDGGRRVALLLMAVTGHKLWRLGQNGTVIQWISSLTGKDNSYLWLISMSVISIYVIQTCNYYLTRSHMCWSNAMEILAHFL